MEIGSRLDYPGSLHHVMGRGAGGEHIFDTEADKVSFLSRLDSIAPAMGFKSYAWALMPNHFHLLLEVGDQGLFRIMHRLLTGFSVSYNKRHQRKGHVFMARFKSILVSRGEYLLELIRYIHLNPLRAGIVRSIEELDDYPWTGHRAMIHGNDRVWHRTEEVLNAFATEIHDGKCAYLEFLSAGIRKRDSMVLESGNLRIGKNGIVQTIGTESDQRRYDYAGMILGSLGFAAAYSKLLNRRRRKTRDRAEEHELIEALAARVCLHFSVNPARLTSSSRGGDLSSARRVLAQLLTEVGISRADISRRLNITYSGVTRLMESKMSIRETVILNEIKANYISSQAL